MTDITDICIRFIDGREITIGCVTDWTIDYKDLFLLVTALDEYSKEQKLIFNLRQVECVGNEEVLRQSYQNCVWR